MGFNVTDLTGPEIERLITALEALGGLTAAIQALTPGLVTTSQRGLYAPDDCIDQGKIKLATETIKGLLSPADKTLLNNPDQLIFREVAALKGAGYRNGIGRGKNLGTFTGTMSDCIKAGDFKGLAIGDTFKYSNRTHTIAHFDPFYRCGDSISLGHHIAVLSDGGWSSVWNDTNTTSGGYVASKIRAYIKSSGGPQEQIIGDFGSGHVLSYRTIYPTTYDSNGKATGWAWTDAMSELINEVMAYGCMVWGINGYEVGIEKFQLALFRLFPELLNIRALWWLRSVYSAANAANVNSLGYANYNSASPSLGVRPLSLIA